jgi:hypothetical protein
LLDISQIFNLIEKAQEFKNFKEKQRLCGLKVNNVQIKITNRSIAIKVQEYKGYSDFQCPEAYHQPPTYY